MFKNRIRKPTENYKIERGTESNRGEEFDLHALHVCTDISQQNPFVQLIYTNKKGIL
jgi:hypothetical protein